MQTPKIQMAKDFYRAEIKLDLPAGAGFMYHQYNNMPLPITPSAVFNPTGFDGEFSSADVIVVGDEATKQYVLAGAATAHRSLTFFSLIKKASNMHSIEVRQPDIMPGDTPEEIVVLSGSDWRELLKQYADITVEKMNVPKFDTSKNLTGYCTWYYYYAAVTEKDFLENLEAMKNHLDSPYKAQVIQIDDGYQTFQGDWNDQDSSWPTPLDEIARRITENGMTAGIWTMPFLASTASRVFREHPDWFVKDENGNPKVAKGWSPPPDDLWVCLDTTIPEACEHLANIFKTFSKWGYNYFKMDGLGFGLMEGRRADENATPVSAFRLGMKAIREAVPEATLLGCCPPFMPCLGYVDMARTSNDTAARWDAVRYVERVNFARWWMFDKFFRCDPDVVIARQDRGTLTPGEARISAMTGIMTGVSLTSDNLATIDKDRFKILCKSAEIRMRDVMPLPWPIAWSGDISWPQVFSGTVDGRKAIAIINDADEMLEYKFEDLTLDPEKEADEILQDLGKRKYFVTVKAHDAVLLLQ